MRFEKTESLVNVMSKYETRVLSVLIVSDSPEVQRVLREMIAMDNGLKVISGAKDPYEAREIIKRDAPDVLVSDIELPRMNGVKFLENLIRLRPIPVVMMSNFFRSQPALRQQVMNMGAQGVIQLPDHISEIWQTSNKVEVVETIKGAYIAFYEQNASAESNSQKLSAQITDDQKIQIESPSTTIIAIGASTGGPEAIEKVLEPLAPGLPGIVIAIHIPVNFSYSLANRLHRNSRLRVKEAEDGDKVLDGHVYIAPGNHHLEVVRSNGEYYCRVNQDPPVNHFRPSVDILFSSVATASRGKSVGIILTGMGRDGTLGMEELKASGALTVAQSEKGCLVFGMPKAAIEKGVIDYVYDLDKISEQIPAFVAIQEKNGKWVG